MEDLWTELAKSGDEYPSPVWPQDVLLLIKKRVKEGKEIYIDWETVKMEIYHRLQ